MLSGADVAVGTENELTFGPSIRLAGRIIDVDDTASVRMELQLDHGVETDPQRVLACFPMGCPFIAGNLVELHYFTA